MSNVALVSIVTPCYNGERYVERFLKSILAQSYQKIELVFIDDGSTDETREIVTNYSEQFSNRGYSLIYHWKSNGGQASALNEGLKYVSGEFLMWMDSDDAISADYIEARVSCLMSDQMAVYCYGDSVWIDMEDNTIISGTGQRTEQEPKQFFLDIMLHRNIFYSGYMVKMEMLERVLPQREIFCGQGGQNAQLLLPLAWFYGSPLYSNKGQYYYYVRSDSHSHSAAEGEKAVVQLMNYEQILKNTLERIDDDGVWNYYTIAEKMLARERFGNAVDTRNATLIKAQYKNLRKKKCVDVKSFLLMVKYTNPIIKILLGVKR